MSEHKRTWEVERKAAVRWLRWMAQKDASRSNDHEASLVRELANSIARGRHCAEGPPVQIERGAK